jgi:MFS transporter, ACS family, hexuronate transporter
VDRFSYRPVFVAAGIMPVFATICVLLLIRTPKTAHAQQASL